MRPGSLASPGNDRHHPYSCLNLEAAVIALLTSPTISVGEIEKSSLITGALTLVIFPLDATFFVV